MTTTVLLTDPAHVKLCLHNGIWFASGLHGEAVELLRANASCEQAESICREIGDALLIRLQLQDENLVQIDAWRGISAGYELFYAVRPDGSILLSDQFRKHACGTSTIGTRTIRHRHSRPFFISGRPSALHLFPSC